jgi:HlyD family secretion protein
MPSSNSPGNPSSRRTGSPRTRISTRPPPPSAPRAKLAAAEEIYQAAHLGPTREELAIADAKVTNAEAAVAVIATRAAKLGIRAPANGNVALLVAEPGEAIIPGQPVMTLEATAWRWASLNLREDQFDDLRIGSPIELLPLGGGEFATWRAARVVGDHDLNTFLVRADPVEAATSGGVLLR